MDRQQQFIQQLQKPEFREDIEKDRPAQLLDYLPENLRTADVLDYENQYNPKPMHQKKLKRWGCNLKCKCGKFRVATGGMQSLLQISRTVNAHKDNHEKQCKKGWKEVWSYHAAEISYDYAEQTTSQTHTGDTSWTSISGAQIPDSFFTTSADYLILTGCLMSGDDGNSVFGVQTTHATTLLDGSNSQFEPSNSVENVGEYHYLYMDKWTAVASEAINMQFKTFSSGQTVDVDTVTMLAMRLDADLTDGSDYDFSRNTTDTSLDTNWSTTNNASITIQSGDHAVNDRYLILAVALQDDASTSQQHESRIERSGEATENAPTVSREGEDTTNGKITQFMARAIQLGASDNTFLTSSRKDAGTGTREYSAIFALNLDKFAVSNHAYTAGSVALSTTDWATEAQTMTFDLSGEAANRNSFVMCYFVNDAEVTAGGVHFCQSRLQIDNSDDPAGQTAHVWQSRSWDATDLLDIGIFTVPEPLTNASHTIDNDADVDDTDGAALQRLIAAFTFELTGGAPPARTLYSGPIPQPIGMI
jgi:hypothetical protein